ncbi:hypothetical protein DL770_006451 [Monosporascus sp. CRB-9-2]|nr:hypothetical protein DL770_006451 [Monosporascus sp. CRB-9-2]
MRIMARSILVTETFIKATKARIGTGGDNAVLTLMSTDIERINMDFMSLHDIWASIIQAALVGWMLYKQPGAVFVAPMGAVIVCFVGLVVLMKFTGDSQRAWMAEVQKRVGLTATVIASTKNLKISGLSAAVGDSVQKLRVEELAAGSRFRKIGIIAALIGYIPLMVSPPVTFAFAQRTLDAARMFTSLAYLLLLTNPLSQIFQSIPQLLSGLAFFGRIQAFLECKTRHDFREVLADMRRSSGKARVDTVVQAIRQAAVMLTSSPYMAISYPFVGALVYIVQRFYLQTFRQLRLLDIEVKSPLYLLVMVQQRLDFVLGVVVMVMAAVLTALAVRLHSNSGFTRASLVTLMNFADNRSGIVIFYTRDEEDIIPPEQWPQSGLVELKGVSASYGPTAPSLGLRDIDLTINSDETAAICGRTGSGQSSLIALLLRVLDPLAETAGNAVIDNMPLHRIDRPALRQRIVAVPQEAVFLPDRSTFQASLDPFDVSMPEKCQAVLAAVDLWQFVQERGGLDSGMSAGILSAGQ